MRNIYVCVYLYCLSIFSLIVYLTVSFDPFQYSYKMWMIIGIQFVCFVCMCAYCFMGCVEMEINAWLLLVPVVLVCGGSGAVLGEGFA